jgi:hypothetical protein
VLQWWSYSVAQAKIFRRRDDGTMGCRRDGAAFIQHAEDEILAPGATETRIRPRAWPGRAFCRRIRRN